MFGDKEKDFFIFASVVVETLLILRKNEWIMEDWKERWRVEPRQQLTFMKGAKKGEHDIDFRQNFRMKDWTQNLWEYIKQEATFHTIP